MLAFEWTPWWGTLPDYLGAAGTVGAFIAGLRLLRKELDTRRDDVDLRKRAQARLVSAWVSKPEPVGVGETRFFDYAVTARNGSDEPVHDVYIELHRMGGERSRKPAAAFYYDVLAPQSTQEGRTTRSPGLRPWMLSISFRDAQGYSWERLPDGTLQLIQQPPATRRRSVKDRLDAFAKGQIDALDT